MRGARSLFRGTIFFFVAISLVTLFYLIVHAELADSNKMTAVKVTGFVDAKLKETGKVVALAERMKVGVGDEITTDSESSVELKLNDGSVIKICADSKVIIKELGQVEVTKISKSTFKLVEGKIRAVVKPLIEKDSKFTIETDNATIGVRGTDFGVIFDLDLGNTEVLSIEDCISVVATNFPGLDAVDVCTKQELLISGVNVPGAVKAIAADKLEEFLKEMGIEGEGGEGEPTGEEEPPEITSAYINNRINLEYLIGTLVVTKSDLNYEKKISVTGTAEDVKYKISKVEVSTDGGMTWGDATGGERWKFEFAPEDKMEYELMMRATNEKGITSDPDDFGSFEIKYLDITYEEIAKDFIDKFFNF
ncbi:MAG: FecR domain-containing protein, partial [Deltaproteobacteria bacterium]